jgi:uncharacterized protein with ParB-like and HNH nuclease domain
VIDSRGERKKIVSSAVEDEAQQDQQVPYVAYDVTSYGSDPDVEGLVRRIRRKEILIPPFQRDYVWRQPEASRFIESLLLGLPVPGIFLATDPETNKLIVIDGQQRLKSLLFFYDGYFNPRPDEQQRRVFSLVKVQKQYEGKTYANLEERDRLRLDNSIIHATIVKQTSPPGDDTSLYHIFERLNSGGRRLIAQEMRVALYHGPLMDSIRGLNEYQAWRNIFGKPNSRLKDQELILRFFALYTSHETYSRPMEEFLSKFAAKNREPSKSYLDGLSRLFQQCCDIFWNALGRDAFRPTRALNVAVFDSCMVGLAYRIKDRALVDSNKVKETYENLLKDPAYVEATSRSTADESFVERRLQRARQVFANLT